MVIPADFDEFYARAKAKRKENKSFFKQLKKKKGKEVDAAFHEADAFVFEKTDCLDCANCCKTTGPLFTRKDIERIAKNFNLKPGDFVEQYLRIDEENDYVLQQVPCTFLDENNYCSIYDIRPKACREFPHTDHQNMQKLLNITAKNVEICPAVFEIVEEVKIALK